MQTAAMTSRFLTGCSSKVAVGDPEFGVDRGLLLQYIVTGHLARTVHSQGVFVKLTNELIRFAEQAYILRDLDALDEVSHVLMNLPVDAARQIGVYYHALAINRRGQRDEADALLESVSDDAPITFRARAIQTLGANHHADGRLDEALRFQIEALRVAADRSAHGLQTALLARWEISIIKSQDGDHRGSLSDLRDLCPLVNSVAKQKPFYLYAYCNAIAVGLGELGHLAEAHATLNVALASPYASAYPNWAETRQELEEKRTSATRSVVSINQRVDTIRSQHLQPQPRQKAKPVIDFCWLFIEHASLQTVLIAIAKFSAIANGRTTCNILDRLGRCLKSRAPPVQA